MGTHDKLVIALGYIVVESARAARWDAFGAEVLGAQPSWESEELRLRFDDRPYRIIVAPGTEDRVRAVGWQVGDGEALEQIEKRLRSAQIDVQSASEAEAFRRGVGGLLRLRDPSGNGLEIFHSPLLANTRFVSPVGVERFVTGDLGFGHVVLPAEAFEETAAFYTRLLGFRLSDRMRLGANEEGAGGMRLQFYHCNPRHHSLALMEAPSPVGLVHFMIEVPTLDEVGYALDRCRRAEVPLSATLGRHTNDRMISFYMKTPSGFDVEFGCGGLRLDLERVSTSEITSVSDWGHDFSVGFRD